jgi:DNA-binding NarL/FixJ family response regulator
MKHIRRADRPDKDHSDDMNFSEKTSVSNRKISYPEPTLNESNDVKLKVFIADDSIEVRNRLKEMLKENKFIQLMGEAADAEQTIIALRDLKPDVVILDIHMPKGEGMRVLKDIKTIEPGRVVIIFTAFPYPQYCQAYITAGADYFFDKTKDFQKMADVLDELAQKYFINRNNTEK